MSSGKWQNINGLRYQVEDNGWENPNEDYGWEESKENSFTHNGQVWDGQDHTRRSTCHRRAAEERLDDATDRRIKVVGAFGEDTWYDISFYRHYRS